MDKPVLLVDRTDERVRTVRHLLRQGWVFACRDGARVPDELLLGSALPGLIRAGRGRWRPPGWEPRAASEMDACWQEASFHDFHQLGQRRGEACGGAG